jgi:NB-ARC domain
MGGTTSMLYSGAVEAAAGTAVSSVVSTVTDTNEIQEGLDLTLYSLHHEILKIESAINAARRRRITDPKLLEWLAFLIDAVNLSNYYHRTFKSQNSYPQMIAGEGMNNLAISPFYRAAKRQRTITTLLFGDEELSKLNNELKKLKSIDIAAFMLMVNSYPEWPIKTYLYMDHNRLFGRDKERDQIMRFLFEPSMASEYNVDILPIVGSKGVGKTSLALHCFYDPKAQSCFSLKMYVRYGEMAHDEMGYGRNNLFHETLKQCNITRIANDDENTLVAMVKQNLSSERFLLVIDDFFPMSFNDTIAFWNCLRCGKAGSKVIVVYGYVSYHLHKGRLNTLGFRLRPTMLDDFSEDDYMLFFKEHAFGSADPEYYPELEKIGREILTKMNGSLWGAKIFGELLRDNLTAQFWSNFLQKGLVKVQFCGDLFSIIEVLYRLLPKQLPDLRKPPGYAVFFKEGSQGHKTKSFRELIVLGPNHCTPNMFAKHGGIYFYFMFAKHVFLNKCTVFVANCNLSD